MSAGLQNWKKTLSSKEISYNGITMVSSKFKFMGYHFLGYHGNNRLTTYLNIQRITN